MKLPNLCVRLDGIAIFYFCGPTGHTILFQGINSVSLTINQVRNCPKTGERDKGKSKKEKKEKERETAKCKQYNGKS